MRRFKLQFRIPRFMPQATSILMSGAMVFLLSGCRNTSAPVSPLGGSAALAPLAPVQGAATLSPIQPTSGISTLGAPTRVPPPATGSYRSPANYGVGNTLNSTSSSFAPGTLMPSGAAISSNGMTRGVTDLNRMNGSGVRQTGWVADSNQTLAFGSGFSVAENNPASPANTNPVRQVSGGMPVIDLTQTPFPPGYVPPQNRPGTGTSSLQTIPSNWNSPAAAPLNPTSAPQTSAPLGQPINSTFDPPGTGNSWNHSNQNSTAVQTANLPATTPLPTTAPYPRGENQAEQLQWRRPSPQF